ncbi:MAG: ubiquinol-cytochrome c reductase iron-sulfur subunit [Elusimicrobia bacterium]|nr:ubiquinol-cytochrome c reductase iron-sulfur subunit [Elusimicrobiota bacterium]
MSEPINPVSAAAPAPALKPAAPAAAMTRGDFLWAGWSMLAAFFAASAAAGARFLFPNVIYEPSQKFNAGPAAGYDLGVSTKWLNEQRVWIVRTPSGFYALWARCTHLGCTPNWWGDQNRFKCPCHGSNYTMEGDVIAGPAPKPLWRAKVDLAPTGDLIVDKSQLECIPGKRELPPYFVAHAA